MRCLTPASFRSDFWSVVISEAFGVLRTGGCPTALHYTAEPFESLEQNARIDLPELAELSTNRGPRPGSG